VLAHAFDVCELWPIYLLTYLLTYLLCRNEYLGEELLAWRNLRRD